MSSHFKAERVGKKTHKRLEYIKCMLSESSLSGLWILASKEWCLVCQKCFTMFYTVSLSFTRFSLMLPSETCSLFRATCCQIPRSSLAFFKKHISECWDSPSMRVLLCSNLAKVIDMAMGEKENPYKLQVDGSIFPWILGTLFSPTNIFVIVLWYSQFRFGSPYQVSRNHIEALACGVL